MRRDVFTIITFSLILLAPSVICSSNLSPILITTIDANAYPGATFSGGRQIAVDNEYGVFMTYAWPYPYNGPLRGNVDRWNLLRSTDGGRTFDLIYTPDIPGDIPALETDPDGNVHLITHRSIIDEQPWYYYRFLAQDNFTDPLFTETSGVSLNAKWCTFLDPETGKLFLFNNEGVFRVLNTTTGGLVEKKRYAWGTGVMAFLNYPHIYVENDVLYHGWTTQRWRGGGGYVYWDIHFAWSPDGGGTWRKADGTQLVIPFYPDNQGATDNIVPREEYEITTWLNSITYKDGKVHLAYFSDLGGRHWIHVRIDLTTGQIDRRDARGETMVLRGNGGFFATAPGQPLYMVSTNRSHICAIVSHDNGETWHDAAVSENPWQHLEYIFGHREITSRGITGCFIGKDGVSGNHGVYFLRIPLSGEYEERSTSDFEFTVKPVRLDIEQGDLRSTIITVEVNDTISGEVQLSAQLPQGLGMTFTPNSGNHHFTSTVNITVDVSTAPGLYRIPVTGSWRDITRNFSFDVNVSEPPPVPDFGIAVEPSLTSIKQGETTKVGVSISPIDAFSDYTSLSVSDLPGGFSASFDPAWGQAEYTSILTLSTDPGISAGTYPINITGVGGGNRHSCILRVEIAVEELHTLVQIALLGLFMVYLRKSIRCPKVRNESPV